MSVSSNNAVIDKALARLKKEKDDTILAGLIKVVRAGMEYLVEAHEAHEPGMSHTVENNTMGYAVGHNGQYIFSGRHYGGDDDLPGSAQEIAQALISETTGWVAFIVSEMDGWYRVDYEISFLEDTMNEIKYRFEDFFKPIVV